MLTGRRHADQTGYAANRTGCGSKWWRYTNKMLCVSDGSIRWLGTALKSSAMGWDPRQTCALVLSGQNMLARN